MSASTPRTLRLTGVYSCNRIERSISNNEIRCFNCQMTPCCELRGNFGLIANCACEGTAKPRNNALVKINRIFMPLAQFSSGNGTIERSR